MVLFQNEESEIIASLNPEERKKRAQDIVETRILTQVRHNSLPRSEVSEMMFISYCCPHTGSN